jgi:thermitase
MSRNPDIEYAKPNYIAYIAVTPNDTFFQYQYALDNSGQSIGIPGSPTGTTKADIKATTAWEETKGNEEVLIAIMDTGVDMDHPDLKNKIHSSGWDFVNEDSDATDDHGHGTHVAGIAAAETNNREGIAGVAWNCKILPVKVVKPDGEGYYSWIIEGIIWAVDNGADVINLSLGGDADDSDLEAAVKYAFDNNVVVAAATGNDGASVYYPAAYDRYCLAVAATDYDDLRTEWSNFGPEVDVAAPGERIIGPVPTWYWGPDSIPYAFGYGTSLAAPHAAGIAALIKSIKPWLKASEIMDVIRYSADDINETEYPGKDDFIGYGRLNMERALVPIKIKTSK